MTLQGNDQTYPDCRRFCKTAGPSLLKDVNVKIREKEKKAGCEKCPRLKDTKET